MSDAVECAHCRLPVPGGRPELEVPQFCCPGCRAVYSMLDNAGLRGFYAARDAAEAGPMLPAEAVEAGRYAHYDTDEFLDRFAPKGDEIELHVEGAHCAACVWLLDRLPEVEPAAREARLDLGRSRLRLRWDPDVSSLGAIAERLHSLGYPTAPLGVQAEAARKARRRDDLIRLGLMGAVAGNAMVIAAAMYAGDVFGDMSERFRHFFEWISFGLAVPAVTYGALPFYRSAWAGLKMRMAHIDLPIALGVLGSFAASVVATIRGSGEIYYDSVTALVFLLLIGRFVQQSGQRAAMNRAELLVALTPGSARKKLNGEWVDVPANTLIPGDLVRVLAGERLPVDGRVIVGSGHLDRSLLTGEDRPVPVSAGDSVHAGTISVGGALEIETMRAGSATRLARLVERVDDAAQERAPVVRLVDRISGLFVITVLSLAVLGGVAWAMVDSSRIFDVVVSLLVVTCPCALGMATPVALAVGRARAASDGILVRQVAALERLATAKTVFFDKTGTLTEGQMTVRSAWLVTPELKGAIGALESHSQHPIARALVQWAGPSGVSMTNIMETTGSGIAGDFGGKRLVLAAPKALDAGPLQAHVDDVLSRGLTPVIGHVDGVPSAVLGLGDGLRPDARDAVAQLQALGLKVGILSGDHPAVVEAVAREVGADLWFGGQSPEQKAAIVSDTSDAVMVGDGFNDAVALRAAQVGIAVHSGAEVAVEVADIFLSESGAGPVVKAALRARETLRTVKRNLLFSLLYNVTFAGLALAGLISPLAAAVLMPISSLTVILHSVLAGRQPEPGGAAALPDGPQCEVTTPR